MNIEPITDAEIFATIRYLDPDSKSRRSESNDKLAAICVSLMLLVAGWVAFFILNHRIS